MKHGRRGGLTATAHRVGAPEQDGTDHREGDVHGVSGVPVPGDTGAHARPWKTSPEGAVAMTFGVPFSVPSIPEVSVKP